MNCEEYRALISCAVDGELTEEEQRRLDAHLTACEDCRAYRDALLSLSEELQRPMEPPAALRLGVMDSVRADMRGKRLRRIRRYGSLAACLVLIASLGLLPRMGKAKSAEAPMMLQAAPAAGTVMTEAATADTVCEPEEAPVPMPEPEAAEKNMLFSYSNAAFLPDAETVARDFLWERDGREYGECSVETVEALGDYTPTLVDYTPTGTITAVHFDPVTVLLDETMTVFGVVENVND